MASYEGINNTLSFAVSFSPSSAFPLDSRQMFGSLAAAQAAAAEAENAGSSNTVYYYGMPLVVFENDQASFYIINGDNTLKTVGSATYGDDKTIVLNAETGTLSLKSFGEEYYAYHEADNIIDNSDGSYTYPDAMPQEATEGDYVQVSGTWYIYTSSAWTTAEGEPHSTSYYTLVSGWKAGLEPKVTGTTGNFSLAWYEPSTTTLEGVSSIVSSLQTTVDQMESSLTDLNEAIQAEVTRATGAEEALDTRLDAAEAAITTLNGPSTQEGSVAKQVSDAIAAVVADAPEDFDTLKEMSDWISEHSDSAATMNSAIQQNASDITALETLVGTIPEEATANDVVSYVDEVTDALDTRLTAAEGTISGLGTAATADSTDFATAAQGALAESAVQQIIADGNGNITVDSDSPINVYTLPNASTTTKGGVTVDGTSITATAEGQISVAAVDYTKVTGLTQQLSNTQTAAVAEAAADAAEIYLPKTDVVANGAEAETVDTASDVKAASEKLVMAHLTWKTTM